MQIYQIHNDKVFSIHLITITGELSSGIQLAVCAVLGVLGSTAE